jgi:hypothetical protein
MSKNNKFIETLISGTYSPEIENGALLYNWLIGSWDITVHDSLPEGGTRILEGEWHFSWALEGRAIQDVWIAPARKYRSPMPEEGNRYGTSIRVYDKQKDIWHVDWFNPVSGKHNQLIAGKIGNEIVQNGIDEDKPYKWVFTDIKENSFRWYAVQSPDDGKTWNLVVEFFAIRQKE